VASGVISGLDDPDQDAHKATELSQNNYMDFQATIPSELMPNISKDNGFDRRKLNTIRTLPLSGSEVVKNTSKSPNLLNIPQGATLIIDKSGNSSTQEYTSAPFNVKTSENMPDSNTIGSSIKLSAKKSKRVSIPVPEPRLLPSGRNETERDESWNSSSK
jgi:hypothetical protein